MTIWSQLLCKAVVSVNESGLVFICRRVFLLLWSSDRHQRLACVWVKLCQLTEEPFTSFSSHFCSWNIHFLTCGSVHLFLRTVNPRFRKDQDSYFRLFFLLSWKSQKFPFDHPINISKSVKYSCRPISDMTNSNAPLSAFDEWSLNREKHSF